MGRPKKEKDENESVASGKETKLDKLLKGITKDYGGKVFVDPDDFMIKEYISSGSIELDRAMGGGFPRGRVVELFGSESSGKSTQCMHLIANAQRAGLKCAYIDTDYCFDKKYAEVFGIDTNPDKLIIIHPKYLEDQCDIANKLIESNEVQIVIIDSIGALQSKREANAEMGEPTIGVTAKIITQFCRAIRINAVMNNVLVVFTSEVRANLNMTGYGGPTHKSVVPQGALHLFSHRLEFKRIQQIKNGDKVVGQKTRVHVMKNKASKGVGEKVELNLIYGKGFDKFSEILDLALEAKLIKKDKLTYVDAETGEELGVGRGATEEWIRFHEDYFNNLVTKILAIPRANDTAVEEEQEEEE